LPDAAVEFIGATSSTEGASGLVPAPAVGDNEKFLKGDGTWAESKGSRVFYGAIGTTWTENEDTGIKTQMVSISGLTADHTGKLDVIYDGDNSSESYATFVEVQNQFLEYITNGFAETIDNGVKFTIFGDPNTVEIPFILEVS
jgi:hypothetical protein